MSLAIAHFAFGAALTSFVVTFLLPRVWYPRTVVLIGGGWAMLPDVHWISPVAADRLLAIHDTARWIDVFWLHRTLDRLDPTDSKEVAALCLAGFVVVTLVGEWRSYRAPRALREAILGDRRSPTERD